MVGAPESLLISLRPDEFSEALLIGVDERFGLFIIFHWRTSNGQFIPESQKGSAWKTESMVTPVFATPILTTSWLA
jgi:hypothetical protein